MPSRYAGAIPAGGSHLERYARRLNAAEINSSFHRPHQHKTYERWARCTPADFRFSVKVPKTMTHDARLADCGALLDLFVADGLRERIGTPVAFEPRHANWFASGTTIGSPSGASRAPQPIPL